MQVEGGGSRKRRMILSQVQGKVHELRAGPMRVTLPLQQLVIGLVLLYKKKLVIGRHRPSRVTTHVISDSKSASFHQPRPDSDTLIVERFGSMYAKRCRRLGRRLSWPPLTLPTGTIFGHRFRSVVGHPRTSDVT